MAQPKEEKLDTSQVYQTNAIVCKVGRAIAIDLNECSLPGNAKNKHMTIMFRKSPKWTNDEIELVSKETDNWIKQKYGSAETSVTFTIDNWGKQSVKILGDLNELCLYLRSKFSSMSNDSQRIPHVELFTNAPNKRGKKEKKEKKDKKNGGKFSKENLEKMIGKIQELKAEKNEEILLLNEQENELQALLSNCDNLDTKTLKKEIKNIAKKFKIKKKEMNLKRKSFKKGGKGAKGRKKEKKQFNKEEKQKLKEERKKAKEEKKKLKEERKRLKKEKLDLLSSARLNALPASKAEIGNKSVLNIYVDGYNVIGCDSICRKSMRSKRGGMKKARQRLAKLLQENFMNKIKNQELVFDGYNINNIKLWFDGNGKNDQYQDIEITFSTKKQIVDDKLVELFSKNDKNDNVNILVITTDKELTLRLHQIGVKVMKSSTFYKTYLKEEDKNEDDEKKEEVEEEGSVCNDNNAPDIDEDDFVQIMAKKLNFDQIGDEEGDNYYDKVGEDTPDEDYDDDDNDYEFTSIFGEEMDLVDSD